MTDLVADLTDCACRTRAILLQGTDLASTLDSYLYGGFAKRSDLIEALRNYRLVVKAQEGDARTAPEALVP